MINLRMGIYDPKPKRYMKSFGITYDLSVLQTMGDQVWYFNCKNVPDPLPPDVTILEGDLRSFIGWGLSEEHVLKLEQTTGGE